MLSYSDLLAGSDNGVTMTEDRGGEGGGSGTECGRRLEGRPYLRSVLPGLEVTGKTLQSVLVTTPRRWGGNLSPSHIRWATSTSTGGSGRWRIRARYMAVIERTDRARTDELCLQS